MTRRRRDTLIVAFGAGGRLGRLLMPILADGPSAVVGIGRGGRQLGLLPTVDWIQMDVAERALWGNNLHDLCDIANGHQQVVIIDLLLSRSTVSEMRRTLALGTEYITRLSTMLTKMGLPTALVLASTTATLAPWIYQTPYGLAKRRQLTRYRLAGVVGTALLLPTLVRPASENAPATRGATMTYTAASALVDQTVSAASTCVPAKLRVCAPAAGAAQLSANRPIDHANVRALARATVLQMAAWTSQRDSLHAHRVASHAWLDITPRILRRQVDHHLVPEFLLRRLAQSLDVPVRGPRYDAQHPTRRRLPRGLDPS